MNSMAVSPNDRQLLKLISQLNSSQKKSLVDFIRSFIIKNDTIEKPSIEDYNKELDRATGNVHKGNFTSFEDLEKEMESW